MKAILVIDMPEDCSDCPLANRENTVEYCTITENEIYNFLEDGETELKKNEDCPLKPMPQRKRESSKRYDEELYNSGYNDCLDEILGGNDEL